MPLPRVQPLQENPLSYHTSCGGEAQVQNSAPSGPQASPQSVLSADGQRQVQSGLFRKVLAALGVM